MCSNLKMPTTMIIHFYTLIITAYPQKYIITLGIGITVMVDMQTCF